MSGKNCQHEPEEWPSVLLGSRGVHVFEAFPLGSLYFDVFLGIHGRLKRTSQPTAFILLCQDDAGICLLRLYPQETTEGN